MVSVKLRKYLRQFVSNSMGLEAFTRLFVPIMWSNDGHDAHSDIISNIELDLYEYSLGYATKEELRVAFQGYLEGLSDKTA